jgi:hypothetical protein
MRYADQYYENALEQLKVLEALQTSTEYKVKVGLIWQITDNLLRSAFEYYRECGERIPDNESLVMLGSRLNLVINDEVKHVDLHDLQYLEKFSFTKLRPIYHINDVVISKEKFEHCFEIMMDVMDSVIGYQQKELRPLYDPRIDNTFYDYRIWNKYRVRYGFITDEQFDREMKRLTECYKLRGHELVQFISKYRLSFLD